MTDKILKLLYSSVFEDRYIGLKLMDELSTGILRKFLKSNFSKGERSYSWLLKNLPHIEIPELYNSQYIKGKKYHYVLEDESIMLDNKAVVKWVTVEFNNTASYKVVETWE